MKKQIVPANHIGSALKFARHARNLSQEDFGVVSSRTYISTLERGMKSPTLSKLDVLAGVLGIHPLTLLALAYVPDSGAESLKDMLDTVMSEIHSIHQA